MFQRDSPCLLRNIYEEEIELTFIKRREKRNKITGSFQRLQGENGKAVFSSHALTHPASERMESTLELELNLLLMTLSRLPTGQNSRSPSSLRRRLMWIKRDTEKDTLEEIEPFKNTAPFTYSLRLGKSNRF